MINTEESKIVIIPTYDEAENIKSLIQKINEVDPDLNILVVDDKSKDGTGDIVENLRKNKKNLNIIHRPRKLGIGSAHMAGFSYAINHEFDYIMTMDADFSHNPIYIPDILKKMEFTDICCGSRYIKGGGVKNWGPIRRMISKGANGLTKILLGSKLNDNTGAYRCYKNEVIKYLLKSNIKSEGYSFFVESSFILQKKGYKIIEVPIIFVDRRYGQSKISKKEVFNSMKLLIKLFFNKFKRNGNEK